MEKNSKKVSVFDSHYGTKTSNTSVIGLRMNSSLKAEIGMEAAIRGLTITDYMLILMKEGRKALEASKEEAPPKNKALSMLEDDEFFGEVVTGEKSKEKASRFMSFPNSDKIDDKELDEELPMYKMLQKRHERNKKLLHADIGTELTNPDEFENFDEDIIALREAHQENDRLKAELDLKEAELRELHQKMQEYDFILRGVKSAIYLTTDKETIKAEGQKAFDELKAYALKKALETPWINLGKKFILTGMASTAFDYIEKFKDGFQEKK